MDDLTCEDSPPLPPSQHPVVVWFHDEYTFYANDCRKVRWERNDEDAIPQPKREGASLMVANFVSADYGFLQSPDGTETAQVLFKAGKARDGYFSSNEILKHVICAMKILEEHFPTEDHMFVFDNATTHMKHTNDALSARHMPKNPSSTWGVDVLMTDTSGNIIFGQDGKPRRSKIQMAPGQLPNGELQPLYFPTGHPRADWFKGMEQILRDRGYETKGLKAECKAFKCDTGQKDCCCHHILFNELDFLRVKSLLEAQCCQHGFRVSFLPKFHCELNFIEMCWGYAKRIYQLNPPSSKEADLKRNVVSALATIPLTSMRR